MARFRSNMKQLLLEKSVQQGYPISLTEVAKNTGLSAPAVSRWFNDEVQRIDAESAAAFIEYFDVSLNVLVDVVVE